MYSRETPGERKERSWERVWSVERLSMTEILKPAIEDEVTLLSHSGRNAEELDEGVRIVTFKSYPRIEE